MGIQVDIRGHKICLCCGNLDAPADCPIRRLLLYQVSFEKIPADELPDGLVVSTGATVETVVVNRAAGRRVIWRHWNNHTMAKIAWNGNIVWHNVELWVHEVLACNQFFSTCVSDCYWCRLLSSAGKVCCLAAEKNINHLKFFKT